MSVVSWEMSCARKVISAFLVLGVGGGGGATSADVTVSPVAIAISSTAFLKRPIKEGCWTVWLLPS